jgi:hypothetical protein
VRRKAAGRPRPLVLDRETLRIFSVLLEEEKKSSLFNSEDLLEIFSLHLVA